MFSTRMSSVQSKQVLTLGIDDTPKGKTSHILTPVLTALPLRQHIPNSTCQWRQLRKPVFFLNSHPSVGLQMKPPYTLVTLKALDVTMDRTIAHLRVWWYAYEHGRKTSKGNPKRKRTEENHVPMRLRTSQIWDWTGASAVRSQRLNARVMARHNI
jgi:hypothetical protein